MFLSLKRAAERQSRHWTCLTSWEEMGREREGRRDRKRKRQGLRLRCNGYMGFPKMKGTILGVTYNKDYNIFKEHAKQSGKGQGGAYIQIHRHGGCR